MSEIGQRITQMCTFRDALQVARNNCMNDKQFKSLNAMLTNITKQIDNIQNRGRYPDRRTDNRVRIK